MHNPTEIVTVHFVHSPIDFIADIENHWLRLVSVDKTDTGQMQMDKKTNFNPNTAFECVNNSLQN